MYQVQLNFTSAAISNCRRNFGNTFDEEKKALVKNSGLIKMFGEIW